ncbi:diaminopimelate epimerase [Hyphobacterium sp.]|uniref:diaminopimelate epimerase n=1 Tax=Hyphobacterium sp. TaxID=2004662 RepID=UPI003BAD86CE
MRACLMNGTGNRFLLIDGRDHQTAPSAGVTRELAKHHAFDQLLYLSGSIHGDARYRIWNRDGSEAGACGNGARCAGWFLMQDTGKPEIWLDAPYGVTRAEAAGDASVRVDLGPARTGWRDIPLAREMDTIALDYSLEAGGMRLESPGAASMGNPHIVFPVETLDGLPIAELGPKAEHDPLFPERVNVGFMEIHDRDHVSLRVWERGAGLTLACGTGAAAAVVTGHRKALLDRKCRITVDGGELMIDWRDDNSIWLEGAVELEEEIELDEEKL